MRFLFNTVYYKPAAGGGGPIQSVSGLAEELVRRNHEVTIAASDLDIPGRLEVRLGADHHIEGVRVRYFRACPTLLQRTRIPMFARSGAFRFGPEFTSWLTDHISHCDVAHSQISFLGSSSMLSRLARRLGKVYLYQQRGNLDPVRLRRGYLKKRVYIELREKPIMRRADALIALTPYEIESFRALGLRNRIEVIPNGIDDHFINGTPRRLSPAVEQLLHQLQGRVALLFLSRIHPVKGPDFFVDAFISIARRFPNACAILAGPDESGMVDSILARVRSADLADRFFHPGLLAGDDRLAVLQRADIFVLPTASEGMAMALLEALATACAVVTCPGAHFPEIESSGAGIITAWSAEAVALGLSQLLSEGVEAIKARGLRGRSWVSTHLSWSAVASKYEALCQELTAHRKSSK